MTSHRSFLSRDILSTTTNIRLVQWPFLSYSTPSSTSLELFHKHFISSLFRLSIYRKGRRLLQLGSDGKKVICVFLGLWTLIFVNRTLYKLRAYFNTFLLLSLLLFLTFSWILEKSLIIISRVKFYIVLVSSICYLACSALLSVGRATYASKRITSPFPSFF